MQPIRTRLLVTLTVSALVLLTALIVAPLLGSTSISLARVFDRSIPFADNADAQIFFIARMPRVLAAALVGASLAAAGVVFRRCCAIRWRRRTRSACRAAPRSAPCWRSRFTFDFTIAGVRRSARQPHRLALAHSPSSTPGDGAAARASTTVLLLGGVT